jgi:hypothetical protein
MAGGTAEADIHLQSYDAQAMLDWDLARGLWAEQQQACLIYST